MTFAEIRDDIRSNLDDAGVIHFTSDDVIDSLQDAYDDIAFQSRCIIKSVSLNFLTEPYIDMAFWVEDFLAATAIFNKNTNRWLLDCLTIRDFDKVRTDWEVWQGTPLFWAHANFHILALVPTYSAVPTQGFDLYYAAKAPTIQTATISTDTPLIDVDMQDLLTNYCTADLLEQDEEYVKAGEFWKLYIDTLEDYTNRVQRRARRDLLVRA